MRNCNFVGMNYLDELNQAQRAAVEHTEGPCMVIAGAGSGKTRVLTYRIAHIIGKGADPFNILALTFTNKAAREMKARIANLIGGTEARNIWMGTFHSIFARILRVEADKLNYPSNFTIYDTADSKNLIKAILKEKGLDEKMYKVSNVLHRISSAKNNLISAKAYAQHPEIMSEDETSGKPKIAEIYMEYNMRLFKSSAMDFDDLLYKTNVLLRDFPDVLHKYQHKFRYIMVDEYQDTNFSQYLIVKKLAALNENLCVVGDDAQSIYGFRGANIQNILNFRKDYPDYKMFKLEQNYRSTKNIVAAANSVIDQNRDQLKKEVWTDNDQGDKIRVVRSLSDNDEGLFVANDIFQNQANENDPYKAYAILYRTNSQSRAMEEGLRKLNIPYRIYGGLSFYQRKEIKDILGYCRLSANPNDEEAFKRVINYPARGIGKTTLEKMAVAAEAQQASLWQISTVYLNELEVNAGTKKKVDEFATMIKSFRADMEKLDAASMVEHIAKSTGLLRELYADKSPEGLSRYENVQELLSGIREFTESEANRVEDEKPRLTDFLVDVALLTDADQDDDDDNKVNLMTIHASKGLEFPHVYIVGLEENLFPSQLSLSERSELEEERRLFYVALTRAERRAILSYAMSRYRYGQLNHCEPSRFIDEIAPEYLDTPEGKGNHAYEERGGGFNETPWGTGGSNPFNRGNYNRPTAYTQRKPQAGPSKTSPAPAPPIPTSTDGKKLKRVEISTKDPAFQHAVTAGSIVAGTQVEHEKFGKGKVLNVEGAPGNEKATVFFPSVGQKQLLLKYAKLKILH